MNDKEVETNCLIGVELFKMNGCEDGVGNIISATCASRASVCSKQSVRVKEGSGSVLKLVIKTSGLRTSEALLLLVES